MSVSRDDLLVTLNELLQPHLFEDYCPNGLQVEGKHQITRLVTGVTASHALIDAAVAANADAILVHHGYFWKGENPTLIGMKQRRIKKLLENDINLFAYHLPLDAHPQYGNNVQLGARLGLRVTDNFGGVGLIGQLAQPMTGSEFAAHIYHVLNREPLHVDSVGKVIRAVAWCTGAAQNYIEKALPFAVDAFLTGEVSEPTVHIARENGIHFFAAGHHATERYGVQAVGQYVAEKININQLFVDIPNPA